MSGKNPHAGFDYSEAAKHLKDLLFQIATVKVNNKRSGIVYKGPEIKSSSILSVSRNIQDDFSKEGISNFSENGTKLDLFILKVFQLGYSVATEEQRERFEPLMEILDKKLQKR